VQISRYKRSDKKSLLLMAGILLGVLVLFHRSFTSQCLYLNLPACSSASASASACWWFLWCLSLNLQLFYHGQQILLGFICSQTQFVIFISLWVNSLVLYSVLIPPNFSQTFRHFLTIQSMNKNVRLVLSYILSHFFCKSSKYLPSYAIFTEK
jgi:hypothetical protein